MLRFDEDGDRDVRLCPIHRHRLLRRRDAERELEGPARLIWPKADMAPVEVAPPPSPRKYWTRRGIAEWLTERLAEGVPTLAGIDHGFSFPLRYFEVHRLKPDWSAFLDDFQRHWPTDENIYVDFVRDGMVARTGSSRCGVGDGSGRSEQPIRAILPA
jgi:hypothetical protein